MGLWTRIILFSACGHNSFPTERVNFFTASSAGEIEMAPPCWCAASITWAMELGEMRAGWATGREIREIEIRWRTEVRHRIEHKLVRAAPRLLLLEDSEG